MAIIKYTPEVTARLISDYRAGASTEQIAKCCSLVCYLDTVYDAKQEIYTNLPEPLEYGPEVPERSVVAKLANAGVYKKKVYTTKAGTAPIRKDEYISRIADLLDVNAEMLESLAKVNKNVLALLASRLE